MQWRKLLKNLKTDKKEIKFLTKNIYSPEDYIFCNHLQIIFKIWWNILSLFLPINKKEAQID